MIVIGERLNSSRSRVLKALTAKDAKYILREAKKQEEAGAQYLDLNAGALLDRELETLKWAVPLIQEQVSIPLAIDTVDPEAMDLGLSLHRGRAMLNSVSGETKRLRSFLPLIREYKPLVIVLCLDDDGIPKEADQELSIAERMVESLDKEGIKPEDIFIDPLVRPIGVDQEGGRLFLESLDKIKTNLPRAKTVAGISNVSYGLPERQVLNLAFLVLALEHGLDAAIIDPLEKGILSSIASTQALLGHDPGLRSYLSFMRRPKT